MGFLTDLFNFNRVAQRSKEFEDLLAARDITAIKEQMVCRTDLITDSLNDYETYKHRINFRPDKEINDEKGRFQRMEKVWKLPIPYPVYINEIAVVFLYGQPVKWTQASEGTDKAFQAFNDVIDRTRFNSKIRECKRLAGAETESAMLFRTFTNKEGKPDVQIKVLARSKGDEIYVRWDEYDNIISIAWGHYIREDKSSVYHFDIYTNEKIYHCSQRKEWEVEEEENLIGKIPIILFQQEKEWAGVETLMHREEYIASHTADTNDYFADPIAILNADMIKGMPSKSADGKTIVVKGQASPGNAASYLTWDSAPQSKKDEMEWLEDKILTMTFTPRIALDSLKSVAQLSGKALRTVMLLADIKASRRKETHDEMLSRTASVITAIIGNVLDVSLRGECDKLKVNHTFSEPFGEDVANVLGNVLKAAEGEVLSHETAVSLNPLVSDPQRELERIKAERDEAAQQQAAANVMEIFGRAQ